MLGTGVGGLLGGGGGIGGMGGVGGPTTGGVNNIGHHQTLFFGPAHGFTQYSSLPRRSVATGSAFQRNTPIRRSTGIPEHHLEYFVPRSVSEFNLSGVGDLALPPPRRCSPTVQHAVGLANLPHGLHLGPTQTLICTSAASAVPPPPPQQIQILMKPREKMVTFEDESKTHCPHGIPTTPRKSSGGGGAGDVFM